MIELRISNISTIIYGLSDPMVLVDIQSACSYSILGSNFSTFGKAQFCPCCKKQMYTADELANIEAKLQNVPVSSVQQAVFPLGQLYCMEHGFQNPVALWEGYVNLFNKKTFSFPTGLLSNICAVLKKHNVAYKLQDMRKAPKLAPSKVFNRTLRDYQSDAINRLIKASRGILKAATGSGKSTVMAGLIAQTGVKTLIVVPTKTIFDQLYTELHMLLQVPIGRIGDGVKDIQKVTLAMPGSLVEVTTVKRGKYDPKQHRWLRIEDTKILPRVELKEYLDSIEAFILDETHHGASSQIQTIARQLPNAYYRWGVSATVNRPDGSDLLINAITGKVQKEITASELIRLGYLSKPYINFIWYKQKPQPRNLTYSQVYNHVITENKERNAFIATLAAQEVAKGHSVLVLVRYLKHGKNILAELEAQGLKATFASGEKSSTELAQIMKDIDSKKIMCCIASSVFGEGISIASLDCIITTFSPDSEILAIQTLGRAMRRTATKTQITAYDIADTGVRFFSDRSKKRLLLYRKEPEYTINEIIKSQA